MPQEKRDDFRSKLMAYIRMLEEQETPTEKAMRQRDTLQSLGFRDLRPDECPVCGYPLSSEYHVHDCKPNNKLPTVEEVLSWGINYD